MTKVTWKGIPQIQQRMRQAGMAVQRGTVALAERQAAEGDAWMKANAPWTDGTGAARAGLFGEVEATPNGAVIVLGGTVPYQEALELGTATSAPQPIIGPAFERTTREATTEFLELGARFGEGA